MPSENIGDCGCAQYPDKDWITAELDLGICYIRHACGEPPDGYELGIIWHEHEVGEYASIGLTWDGPEDAPWDYIRRAESALSRFDEAVHWSELTPEPEEDADNEDEPDDEEDESDDAPDPVLQETMFPTEDEPPSPIVENMSQESVRVGVDLKSESLATDLLDCIAGFPLFVDELRAKGAGEDATAALVGDLINLFRKADDTDEDLRLLGGFAPDLLYVRASELQMFDRWTRVYAKMVPYLLLDQMRVRGICSFYILDNSIREDRFDALVKIFDDVGFSVISPNIDGATEEEVLDRIDCAQVLRKHILYVERDASINYLAAVQGIQKAPWYTVAFRNQAPSMNSMKILQLAGAAHRD